MYYRAHPPINLQHLKDKIKVLRNQLTDEYNIVATK